MSEHTPFSGMPLFYVNDGNGKMERAPGTSSLQGPWPSRRTDMDLSARAQPVC